MDDKHLGELLVLAVEMYQDEQGGRRYVRRLLDSILEPDPPSTQQLVNATTWAYTDTTPTPVFQVTAVDPPIKLRSMEMPDPLLDVLNRYKKKVGISGYEIERRLRVPRGSFYVWRHKQRIAEVYRERVKQALRRAKVL